MTYALDVQRTIDAPVEVVYRARTDIAIERKIAEMHDTTSEISGEIAVGKTRVAEWTQDECRCRVTQTFLEIGDRHVVYSELLEVPPSPVYETVITETMSANRGKTLFHFHVAGFPTAEERDIHRKGYNIVLDRLEAYLASSRES